MHQKLVTDLFLSLVNTLKKPLDARNFFIRYFERELSKSLKKLTLFFLLNSFPFNGQDHEKQKGPGTSDKLLFRLQKFRKIHLLVMYYLTKIDDVV